MERLQVYIGGAAVVGPGGNWGGRAPYELRLRLFALHCANDLVKVADVPAQPNESLRVHRL